MWMKESVWCALQSAVAAVLGICFRLFVDPKNPDSVVNTAATTVRQVSGILRSYSLLKSFA